MIRAARIGLALGALAAVLAAVLAGGAPPGSAAASRPGGGLEGRWRLVEPSGEDAPILLIIERRGPALTPRLLVGPAPERTVDWPAFASDAGLAPVVVHASGVDAGRGEIHAAYRVPLAGSPGRALEVVERYRLAEDGGSLAGTVEVLLIEEGEPRGSYRIHRRFEREP